jgi:two-component system, chemotaxis family, protein-glutamate methylesterase/glutaminase
VTAYAGFDAVVIAASQGGLAACRRVVEALPADFPAAIIFAQHRSPGSSAAAARLLRRWCWLDVLPGVDGAPLEPGTLTVPPADARVGVTAERRLSLSEADPGLGLADGLLASAAEVYGPRALAIVLTGRLRDGTQGVRAVKASGGRVIVQDPASAEQASMPWNALATGCVDLVLDLPRIADALLALVTVPGAADLFAVRPLTAPVPRL